MKIDRPLLEAYGQAEISRRDISDRMGAEVSFGGLVAAFLTQAAKRVIEEEERTA